MFCLFTHKAKHIDTKFSPTTYPSSGKHEKMSLFYNVTLEPKIYLSHLDV